MTRDVEGHGASRLLPNDPLASIGRDVERSDAKDKTTGRAVYTVDIDLPGMLHAKVLRSSRPHAMLLRVDAEAARRARGVHAVLTRDDVPEHVVPSYGWFVKDQPIVASDRVRFVGEVVAAVAAESEADAIAALKLIQVEYEDLPVVAGIEAALDHGAPELFPSAPPGFVPHYGPGARGALRPAPNVCYEFGYTCGDAALFETCDHVFEDEFRFSRMQHYHLEPFVSVVRASAERLEVWSATQTPFLLRKELANLLRIAETSVSVKTHYVGGAFGAKAHLRTEPIAALLSQASGRPVRFCLTLEEAFFTSSQHAAVIRLKTGVMSDGRVVARQGQIDLDAGAYSDASPLVAEKAGYRLPGGYRFQHIDSIARCVMTNTTPAGAFRGFGGTQALWASESQIDMIARRLGVDPFEMRRMNLIGLGEPFVPGESGCDSDMVEGLALVADRVGYGRPLPPNQGIGIAVGFKDGGGVNKPAQARVKVTMGGDVFLATAAIEMGQGSGTALSQIVAEILRCPLSRVRQVPIDTDSAPFDPGTHSSSGTVVMGRAVEKAAVALRDKVLDFASEAMGVPKDELLLEDWQILHGQKVMPLRALMIREFGGPGFEFTAEGYFKAKLDDEAPLDNKCVFWEIGWAAAKVAVDVETGRFNVLDLCVSGDAGRAINPLTCRGQDEGAAVMAYGQTLFERMLYDGEGRLLNGDPLMYRLAMSEDLPQSFQSILQEQGHGAGPFGAKGMGEGTMLPVASAIANAIHDAVGVRVTELPVTAERVLRALRERDAASARNCNPLPSRALI